MTRQAIFEAVRASKGRIDPDDVPILDAALDRIGIARVGGGRRISQAGVDLIKQFEGLRLTAYRDAVGIWTIGYGSTGAHVRPGLSISSSEAEALLRKDLSRFEACVAKACPNATDNQFAAMVSLAFNIGCDAFVGSSICKAHQAGDYRRAQASFALWNKADGKVLAGLVKRRAAEAELYAS